MNFVDDEIDNAEGGHKRRRSSKFDNERAEEDVQHHYISKSPPHTQATKRPRSDAFEDLLQQHQNARKSSYHHKNNNNNNNRNKKHPHKDRGQPHYTSVSSSSFNKEFCDISPSISIEALTRKISGFLNEDNVSLIEVMISHLGVAPSVDFVRQTVEAEENGGIMTTSKPSRRRSPGGVLFYLLKERTTPDMRKVIFTDERAKVSKKKGQRTDKVTHGTKK